MVYEPADLRETEQAWARYSVTREKATFATANLMICLLVPAWSAFDFYLEPALAPQFLALRLADVAVTALLWRFITRSSDPRSNRRAMALSVLAVGLTIVAMLPQIELHYTLYVFGFSLVFWGCGLLLLWPAAYAVWTFGAILTAHVIAHAAFGYESSTREFIGSLFYLASAVVISGAQQVVRRRLEHDAFAASFTLEKRNVELASTVEALAATQARLAASSARLTESLDVEATAQHITRIAVPNFASWAFVVGKGPQGTPVRAAEHLDPAAGAALAAALAEDPPSPLAAPSGTLRFVDVTEHTLSEVAGARVARTVTARSLMAAPLFARGEAIGLLVLGRADRNFDPSEVAFAEEIAHRAALALDNARLFREAGDAVRVRDEFISIAGHELRTPLTALQLHVERLSRMVLPPSARVQLQKVSRQVERLTGLIGQLLDVSKLAAGRLAIEREDMDLAEVVREVVERFHDEAERHGSILQVSAPASVTGRWDRTRLDQVISNLVSNAIKYGCGKPIGIALEARDGLAVLSVADQGIGISEQDQARVFQRFERAVSVTHYGGFGLGLWIARLIVEALDGEIRVQSQPDAGSTFVVELPSAHHA